MKPTNYLFILLFLIATSAYGQRQTLLVLSQNEHNLTFIDATNMSVLSTIKTGIGPHEVCVSDDGKFAFVSNYGNQKPGNTISVVDVEQRKQINLVDLGSLLRPHGMVFKNGKVYVTAELNRAIFRYDPVANKVDWLMGHGSSISHMLVVSPDEKKAYTADMLSNTVTMVNIGGPPTPAAIKQIPVGTKPEAIEISPDGKEVWVGQNDDGHISIINTTTNKVEQTIAIGKLPYRIKFTPDGKHVLISDPVSHEIVIIDAKTKAITQRVQMESAVMGVAISKDSKHAYVSMGELNVVVKIDLTTFKELGRAKTGINPDGVAVSYMN